MEGFLEEVNGAEGEDFAGAFLDERQLGFIGLVLERVGATILRGGSVHAGDVGEQVSAIHHDRAVDHTIFGIAENVRVGVGKFVVVVDEVGLDVLGGHFGKFLSFDTLIISDVSVFVKHFFQNFQTFFSG